MALYFKEYILTLLIVATWIRHDGFTSPSWFDMTTWYDAAYDDYPFQVI